MQGSSKTLDHKVRMFYMYTLYSLQYTEQHVHVHVDTKLSQTIPIRNDEIFLKVLIVSDYA